MDLLPRVRLGSYSRGRVRRGGGPGMGASVVARGPIPGGLECDCVERPDRGVCRLLSSDSPAVSPLIHREFGCEGGWGGWGVSLLPPPYM